MKLQVKRSLVNLSLKKVRRARYIKQLGTKKYKKLTRLRNAVEGVPSVLRRKYNVDRIPVRGIRALKNEVLPQRKVAGIKIKRVTNWS